jgi:hypothetical protein
MRPGQTPASNGLSIADELQTGSTTLEVVFTSLMAFKATLALKESLITFWEY